MACKRSPVRSRYSPPLAQIRVTNTVDFKSKSTVFLCLSASKFIAILQILCKIKVEVHMDLVSAINFYPADKLADDHLFCFKAGTIVQVCVQKIEQGDISLQANQRVAGKFHCGLTYHKNASTAHIHWTATSSQLTAVRARVYCKPTYIIGGDYGKYFFYGDIDEYRDLGGRYTVR